MLIAEAIGNRTLAEVYTRHLRQRSDTKTNTAQERLRGASRPRPRLKDSNSHESDQQFYHYFVDTSTFEM